MNIFVIGGGPAGMMGAIVAARHGANVTIIEKNEKLGKKLYITGKGRCNLTNCSDFNSYMDNIITNNKFLFSTLKSFDSACLVKFFEEIGLKTKVERGNRVFPISDKSSDVIAALQKEINRLGIKVIYDEKVIRLGSDGKHIKRITTNKNSYEVDRVLLATGGKSYPLTGSTGDGYRLAGEIGHCVTNLVPGLVGIRFSSFSDFNGEFLPLKKYGEIIDLNLRNVNASIINENGKVLLSEFGEMVFTGFGAEGPIILTLSSLINKMDMNGLFLSIDLKPALSEEQLEKRVIKDFEKYSGKVLNEALKDLLPKDIINLVIAASGLKTDSKVANINKNQRKSIVKTLKGLKFKIDGLNGFDRAIITSGGISVKEINPKNMASKKIDNLFFAGELIDVDALTGGYNLQIAFATGYIAGENIVL